MVKHSSNEHGARILVLGPAFDRQSAMLPLDLESDILARHGALPAGKDNHGGQPTCRISDAQMMEVKRVDMYFHEGTRIKQWYILSVNTDEPAVRIVFHSERHCDSSWPTTVVPERLPTERTHHQFVGENNNYLPFLSKSYYQRSNMSCQ